MEFLIEENWLNVRWNSFLKIADWLLLQKGAPSHSQSSFFKRNFIKQSVGWFQSNVLEFYHTVSQMILKRNSIRQSGFFKRNLIAQSALKKIQIHQTGSRLFTNGILSQSQSVVLKRNSIAQVSQLFSKRNSITWSVNWFQKSSFLVQSVKFVLKRNHHILSQLFGEKCLLLS